VFTILKTKFDIILMKRNNTTKP